MNKKIIFILIFTFFIIIFKNKENFFPFDVNTKTTYLSIPKICFSTNENRRSSHFICKNSKCWRKIKRKDFTFIKTPCSGKEEKKCRKCLLQNLNMSYDDSWNKCQLKKKCLDLNCKDGFYGLEGIWKNKKNLKI
jgi:hypothetical protein